MTPLYSRTIRCQGAIVRQDHILLIRHQNHADGGSYWLLPGGGLEEHETPEACLLREMKEETNLDVQIERLLMEDDATRFPDSFYQKRLTFLCTPLSAEERPGYEPEPEAAAHYSIAEVRWVNLRNETECMQLVGNDPWSRPTLQRIRRLLGYDSLEDGD
jgi:ADP-ribose pyrophosphatase YjhB (NUDIX family)